MTNLTKNLQFSIFHILMDTVITKKGFENDNLLKSLFSPVITSIILTLPGGPEFKAPGRRLAIVEPPITSIEPGSRLICGGGISFLITPPTGVKRVPAFGIQSSLGGILFIMGIPMLM